jgi:O-succinylhomoserine sulfhydrylase
MRMERHCTNAMKVATFLEKHPKVERVLYPHLKSFPQYVLAKNQMSAGGNMIAFEVKGGKKAAFKMMNCLQVIDISNNLGDAKSLITHPATTTHSNIDAKERANIGISDGLMRLSVGIEDADDLIADLKQALGS